MHPVLVIALAAAAALPLGLWLRHDLNKLGYRTADEHDLPHPGARWWVVWATAIAVVSTCVAAVLSDNPPACLPLVPLAFSGPWLAAVDFDVMRIPNSVLAPTASATLFAVGGVAAAEEDWRALLVPVVTALVTGAVFTAVHFATKGGIGLGDVKLASVIALAIGSLDTGAAWLSILTGSAAALVWARTTRRLEPIPYGPWLLCGCLVAVLSVGLTLRLAPS